VPVTSLLLVGALTCPSAGIDDCAAVIALQDPVVHLRDLVEPDAFPASYRSSAGRADLLRLPTSGRAVRFTGKWLAQRIAALVPGLSAWAPGHVRASYTLAYRPEARRQNTAKGCLGVLRPIEAGAVLHTTDFAETPCNGGSVLPSFVWDSALRTVRSGRALKSGELVPRFAGYGTTRVYAGDSLALESRTGSVTVQRSVTALQSARAHERLLVRTGDGTVLSAPLEVRP